MNRSDLEDRLDVLAALDSNWDSYGGRPPTDTAITVARHIIRSLAVFPGSLAVFPMSNGGIQIEMRHGSLDLDVAVSPDGGVSIYV